MFHLGEPLQPFNEIGIVITIFQARKPKSECKWVALTAAKWPENKSKSGGSQGPCFNPGLGKLYKWLERRHFRFHGSCGLCCNYSTVSYSAKAAIDSMETNKCGGVPIKLYLKKQGQGSGSCLYLYLRGWGRRFTWA